MRPARSPRIIGKKEYAERRKAIEHVHRNKGKLADVPDGVVIDVILADAKDAYGNPLTPDMLDKGLPDRWSSPRFEGKKVKPGQQSNEIWEVHRVKDKLTGEVWYLKTSEYGDDDALLEMVGANAAEMLEFGNRLDHIRVGEVRNRANKKGRWVMMRSVDEWDHGKALKGKNVKFQDAADVYLTPEQKKNINPRDAARMALMDFVLGNQDRHQGNFQVAIVGNDVRLAMIDMGLIGGGRAPDMGYRGKPHEFLLKEQMGKKIADYAYQFNNGLGGLRKLGYNHGGDQRKQEIFARQARRAAERLRSEIDTLFNKEVYERNGITLTPTEQKHLDAMRTVALDRLNYILNKRGLDDLVRYFG
jgi:hypothetical protein